MQTEIQVTMSDEPYANFAKCQLTIKTDIVESKSYFDMKIVGFQGKKAEVKAAKNENIGLEITKVKEMGGLKPKTKPVT